MELNFDLGYLHRLAVTAEFPGAPSDILVNASISLGIEDRLESDWLLGWVLRSSLKISG